MDPISVILATILAAAASDQVQQSGSRQKRDPWPPGKKPSRQDLVEAAALLGEEWPNNLTPMDWAWMGFMETYGTPVQPWTPQQLAAFQAQRITCPLGHDIRDVTFEYVDMNINRAPVQIDRHDAETRDFLEIEPTATIQTGETKTEESVASGLAVCTHPDHTDENKTFWFPYQWFDVDYTQ